MSTKDIVTNIRNGVLDVNSQELFFPILIKGLLLNLNKEISIRNNIVPHYILHTGNDIMYLEHKGYNINIEPEKISNEDWIYSVVPRCIVSPGSIDIDTAQLTSPYSKGNCQIETNDEILSLTGEFRRVPIKLGVELKYYTESYTDMLELIQHIITNLVFIKTYNIVYLGQNIVCSYKIPENFGEEHTMDLDGMFQDNRDHTLSLSLEVETNIPVFSNKTMICNDNIITNTQANIKIIK